MKYWLLFIIIFSVSKSTAQNKDALYDIIENTSAAKLEKNIRLLANFGTRHTLSDTLSETRGIGAARRWIKSEFEKIDSDCSNCLDVFYQKDLVKKAVQKLKEKN